MKKLKCNVAEYGIIVNQREEFLILKLATSKKFPKEAWMLPGGRLDEDDQAGYGLQREVLEETNLKIKVVSPVHTARWGDEKPSKYAVFYLCILTRKDKIKLSKEHIDYKWVKFSSIDQTFWHNQNSEISVKKAEKLYITI